jgi:hypothetical protein
VWISRRENESFKLESKNKGKNEEKYLKKEKITVLFLLEN